MPGFFAAGLRKIFDLLFAFDRVDPTSSSKCFY
jgi:hypothetical protein